MDLGWVGVWLGLGSGLVWVYGWIGVGLGWVGLDWVRLGRFVSVVLCWLGLDFVGCYFGVPLCYVYGFRWLFNGLL